MRSNQFSSLVIVLVVVFLACSDGTNVKKFTPNHVVITTPDSSHQSEFSKKQARLQYLDQDLLLHTIFLAEDQLYRIPLIANYLEISYQDRESKRRFMVLRKGDSVRLDLNNRWPQVEILNRTASYLEANFEKVINEKLYEGKTTAREDFYYYWNQFNDPRTLVTGELITEELAFLKQKAIDEIAVENVYIDSLVTMNSISETLASYYKVKNNFERNKIQLFDADSIRFENSLMQPIMTSINYQESDSIWNKELFLYQSNFIKLHHRYHEVNKMGKLDSLGSLLNQPFYQTRYGKHLIFNHVDYLLDGSSVADGKRLLSTVSLDSATNTHFRSLYSLDEFDKDWIIADRFERVQLFDHLLNKHQGKKVFIYLWSASCPYHNRIMPAFTKLMQTYDSQDIVFIPIAVSVRKEEWKWRDNKYFGSTNIESYQVDSLDRQKIKRLFIPRFVLFDEEGKLLHGNAPFANSEEVIPFLDSYLERRVLQ